MVELLYGSNLWFFKINDLDGLCPRNRTVWVDCQRTRLENINVSLRCVRCLYTLVCTFFSAGRSVWLCAVSSLYALWSLHALILLHDPGNDLACVSRIILSVSSLVCVAWELPYVSLIPCCCCTGVEVFEYVGWRVEALMFSLLLDCRRKLLTSFLVP